MAAEWAAKKIGALGRVVTGKTPSTSDSANFNGPYPFITIPDLDGRVVIDRTERTLSQKGADIMRSCLLPSGAVMMSCIATVGKCGVTARPSFTNQQINSVIPDDDTDPRFLYYIFTQLGHELESAGGGGSVYTNVSKSRFSDIEVTLPEDISEQRAIAHILGTLDDKIELNRRMNETLEAMARALFKMEGRDPGLPKPLADLFPDSFEDSELGEIPKGWEVGPLDSVLVLQRGFDLPATQRTSGAYPVLAASGPSGTHNEFMVRGPGVTTGRSGVLGKVFYVDDDFWPLNTSLWVKEFRHSRPAYAFHLLRGIDFAMFNAGSAVPTLNRNHVHTLPTLLPPMGLVDAFERVATTSLTRQKHNDHQSRTLAAVRNTLLPKLLSGDIRVSDTAKLTGDVA